MANQSFAPITGVITEISPFPEQCGTQNATIQTSQGIVHFIISKDTYVVGSLPLMPGMRVTAFYDTQLPVPLIYPPRYQAAFVTVATLGETVAVNYFDENLVAVDNSLKLNIGSCTEIITANGQLYHCYPGQNLLIVYYIATTRSIPPQTTPRKIIVLC